MYKANLLIYETGIIKLIVPSLGLLLESDNIVPGVNIQYLLTLSRSAWNYLGLGGLVLLQGRRKIWAKLRIACRTWAVIKEELYSQQAQYWSRQSIKLWDFVTRTIMFSFIFGIPLGFTHICIVSIFLLSKLAWRASKFHVNQKGNQLSNLNIYRLNPTKEMSYQL